MAHVPADGPLGLDGRHELKGGVEFGGPLSEYGVFMYGKRQAFGTSYIKLDRITGLHGLGDADDFRQPAEGRTGENIYPSAQRGKTIVYEGRIVGATLPGLRQQATNLRRAAAEARERYQGSITIVDPAATTVGYATSVRVMALDIDDVQEFGPTHLPSLWVRSFSLGIRAHDPRFVWYPVAEDLSNSAGSTVVVANNGNAPADLKFDIFSAGALGMTPLIENLTTGKQLKFGTALSGLPPIPTGDLLHVDWSQRAAVKVLAADYPAYTPNVDMMPYLDLDNSDWWNALEWGLAPGNNSIKVSGTGVGDWDVYWQHTSW